MDISASDIPRFNRLIGWVFRARLWLVIAAFGLASLNGQSIAHELGTPDQDHHERDCGLCLVASRDDDGEQCNAGGTGDRAFGDGAALLATSTAPNLRRFSRPNGFTAPDLGGRINARDDSHQSRAPPVAA
ncbi:MAG: hypothetical protein AAF199_07765 [Pseudomonadota bacterium]